VIDVSGIALRVDFFSYFSLMLSEELLSIVNVVRANKGLAALPAIQPETRLREDVGFESLDLAEFTVRIEEKFGVDVFADGLVATVGEVAEKIAKG
jgi:acyl carrier protein